jgi:hypothetical protein
LGRRLVPTLLRRQAAAPLGATTFRPGAADDHGALDVAGPHASPRLRAELLVELARALDDAGLTTSSLDAAAAAALASEHGWDELTVEAALSFAGQVLWARDQDRRGRELVKAALERCRKIQPPLTKS